MVDYIPHVILLAVLRRIVIKLIKGTLLFFWVILFANFAILAVSLNRPWWYQIIFMCVFILIARAGLIEILWGNTNGEIRGK